jgi:DNA-binding NarL/FixJ family response regulator
MESVNLKEILSKSEYRVMELVSSGELNKEVAIELSCEECTVKKHLQHIFPKLGVQNRTEATLKFIMLSGKAPFKKRKRKNDSRKFKLPSE